MSGRLNNPNPSNSQDSEMQLMERCVSRENMRAAWKRVMQNRGAAGVDGKSIEDTGKELKQTWVDVRQELLDGTYQPLPVRSVEIPKPGGGVRQLGIPTVRDRLVQQCILQILQEQWDPTFHPNSYGFRPGKSAHQAIRQVRQYIQEGRTIVVDVDLEKFFDRVNHDILMDRVMKRVKDKRVVDLIRRFLKAGMMQHGLVGTREEGTPQGGPLSPLLSNLLLNEVDWELDKRGLAFARYADDCNVYVRTRRSGERVMKTMEKLMGRLKLKINSEKSAIGYAGNRKFLGFSIWFAKGRIVKSRVAPQALQKFKAKVRSLTKRNCGESLEDVVEKLNRYLMGWRKYFQLAETPQIFMHLDSWIRERLRMLQIRQWKRGKTCYRELVARGLSPINAARVAKYCRSPWKAAHIVGSHWAFSLKYFDEELELERLKPLS